MTRTIGRHIPATAPRGDYVVECHYCGVPWYRSLMREDGGGHLVCPHEGDGLDAISLQRLESAPTAAEVIGRRDGKLHKHVAEPLVTTLEDIVGSGGRS